MDLAQTMAALKKAGNAQTKKTWLEHGATGELFGVKIADMKVIAKKIKGRQDLALELYATGNLDAMYLAGLVTDGSQMSKKQLAEWVAAARWNMISEYTVPWCAAESTFASELAHEWIDSQREHVAAAGWNTWSGIVSMREDDELDLPELKTLLKRVEQKIDGAQNRVRYCMNGFVMAVGGSVAPLLAQAKATAKKLGKVAVEMGGTACKVPLALETIEKIESMGRVGKKRKTTKC